MDEDKKTVPAPEKPVDPDPLFAREVNAMQIRNSSLAASIQMWGAKGSNENTDHIIERAAKFSNFVLNGDEGGKIVPAASILRKV